MHKRSTQKRASFAIANEVSAPPYAFRFDGQLEAGRYFIGLRLFVSLHSSGVEPGHGRRSGPI